MMGMPGWWIVLLLAQDPESARVSMRVGIVGGIVPPTVRLTLQIEASKDAVTVKVSRRREDGKTEERSAAMTRKEFEGLMEDLQPLWGLPREDPEGSEDIYGLDTGVSAERGGKRWANGGPEGCTHGTSKVRPNDAQKEAFRKVVERLHKVADEAFPPK